MTTVDRGGCFRSRATAHPVRRPMADHRSRGLVDDTKVEAVSCVAAPTNVHLVHSGAAWAVLCPRDEVLDPRLLALGENLDGPVGTVPNPPRQAKPLGFALCGSAEEHALDTPKYAKINLFQSHSPAT